VAGSIGPRASREPRRWPNGLRRTRQLILKLALRVLQPACGCATDPTDGNVTTTARVGLASGAIVTSSSAVILAFAAVSPATATATRCLFALPVIAVFAWFERRAEGSLTRQEAATGLACGALFALDMLFWTQAIPEVGAGLSTVLANAQVAIVPFLAWLVDGERIPTRFLVTLPVIMTGVVLAGGILEDDLITGSDPLLGTMHCLAAALCYSGFLYLLRRGGKRGRPVQGYALVLAASVAVSVAMAPLWQGLSLPVSQSSLMWILVITVTNQVVGWLLIAVYSPRLTSDTSSALLLLTPIGAIALGAGFLHEYPSFMQLIGCALILGAAYAGTKTSQGRDATYGAGAD
jgi:drug/metabolite transporter (DMT)-like permease